MAIALPLEHMSTDEKLRAMEEIWENLSRNPASVPVPEWHRSVLQERGTQVREGKATFEDWSDVKQRLRDLTR